MSQGIVHGGAVTCPLHNMVISLETGYATGADEGQVRTFRLQIDGETILIDTTSSKRSPRDGPWESKPPHPEESRAARRPEG